MKFNQKHREIVALNSGGFDSVVLLQVLRFKFPKANIHSLFFSYGQNNVEQERRCSKKVSDKVGATFTEITIPPISWTKNNFYGKDFKDAQSQYLEMRNLIFLSYALSFAQSIKATDIYMAILKSHCGYSDTSEMFCREFDDICKLVGIRFRTPFTKYDKESFIKEIIDFNITEDDFFSCDTPIDGKKCETCSECVYLREIYTKSCKFSSK